MATIRHHTRENLAVFGTNHATTLYRDRDCRTLKAWLNGVSNQT